MEQVNACRIKRHRTEDTRVTISIIKGINARRRNSILRERFGIGDVMGTRSIGYSRKIVRPEPECMKKRGCISVHSKKCHKYLQVGTYTQHPAGYHAIARHCDAKEQTSGLFWCDLSRENELCLCSQQAHQ